MEVFSQTPRKRDCALCSRAKRTVEPRIVRVGVEAQLRHIHKSYAVHLVERSLGIPGTAAAAKVGVQGDVLYNFNTHAAAETLEKIFVPKPGSHQLRIECGNIAKISVVHAELDPGNRLQPHGEKTAADSGGRRCNSGISTGLIGLQSVEDGKGPLEGN